MYIKILFRLCLKDKKKFSYVRIFISPLCVCVCVCVCVYIYIYDLASNSLQGLICYKTQLITENY